MTQCDKLVETGQWSNYHQAMVTRRCGSMHAGETLLCDKHLAQADKEYPQGWRGYPGDTCKHGIYVGGCMEDFMCGACEGGE